MNSNKQEKCDYCKRSLRIRILSTKPLKYEIYGNISSQKYGGLFCSSYCCGCYIKIKNAEEKNKKKCFVNKS